MYSASRSTKRRRLASGGSIGTQSDVLGERSKDNVSSNISDVIYAIQNSNQFSSDATSRVHSHFTRSKNKLQNINQNEINTTKDFSLHENVFGSNLSFSENSSTNFLTNINPNQENKSTIANAAKQNIKRKITSAIEKVRTSLSNSTKKPKQNGSNYSQVLASASGSKNTKTKRITKDGINININNSSAKNSVKKTKSNKKPKQSAKDLKQKLLPSGESSCSDVSSKKNSTKKLKTGSKRIGSKQNKTKSKTSTKSNSKSSKTKTRRKSNQQSSKRSTKTKTKTNSASGSSKLSRKQPKTNKNPKRKKSRLISNTLTTTNSYQAIADKHNALNNSKNNNKNRNNKDDPNCEEMIQAGTILQERRERQRNSQVLAQQQHQQQQQQQQQHQHQHHYHTHQSKRSQLAMAMIGQTQFNNNNNTGNGNNGGYLNRVRRTRISTFQNCSSNNNINNQIHNTHNMRFNGVSNANTGLSAANINNQSLNQNNHNININNNNNNSNHNNTNMRSNHSNQAKYNYDEKGYIVFEKGLIMNNRFEMIKALGKGTFSKVFMCNDLIQGGKKAVKVIRNVDKYQIAARTEAKILQYLRDNDPNNNFAIIHVCEISYYQAHPIFVFPLYGRSLYRFIADNQFQPMPMGQVKSIVKQITKAVAYVHALGVIITDLKPENIIIVDDTSNMILHNGRQYNQLLNPSIKLIDLGSAIFDRKGWHTHLIQTRHYRAPEVMFKFNWSFAADVWSIGCIIVELIFGKMLFNTHDTIDHLNQIIKCIGEIPNYMFEMIEDTTYTQLFNYDDTLNLQRAKISPTQCTNLEAYFGLPKNYYPKHLKMKQLEKTLQLSTSIITQTPESGSKTKSKTKLSRKTILESRNKMNGKEKDDNQDSDIDDAEKEGYQRISSVEKNDSTMSENIDSNIPVNNSNNSNDESEDEDVCVGPQRTLKKSKLRLKLQEFRQKICADPDVLRLYDLTRKMLTWDANSRISARTALKHEYFTYKSHTSTQSNSKHQQCSKSRSVTAHLKEMTNFR